MGPSGNLSFCRRSYLERLSPYNDEALSGAIWGKQNNELTKIWPPVEVEREIPQSKLAVFFTMARELVMNNSTGSTHSMLPYMDLLILVLKFPKGASWDTIGTLMNLAYRDSYQTPREFTQKSFEYLIEKAGENAVSGREYQMLMQKLPKGYLYNLMKLGLGVFLYKFPHKKFEGLMEYAHHLFPEEFPQELFTNSYGDDGSEYVASLQEKILSLKQKAEEQESLLAAIEFKIFVRQLLTSSTFIQINDKRLMQEALSQFPNEFESERHKNSYRVMIAILMEQLSMFKDKDIIYWKLDCLRNIAIHFRWSNKNDREWFTDEDFGKQFFILCIKVSEWNRDFFHPPLEGLRMYEFLERERKGLSRISCWNVGYAIDVLHRKRSS